MVHYAVYFSSSVHFRFRLYNNLSSGKKNSILIKSNYQTIRLEKDYYLSTNDANQIGQKNSFLSSKSPPNIFFFFLLFTTQSVIFQVLLPDFWYKPNFVKSLKKVHFWEVLEINYSKKSRNIPVADNLNFIP